VIHLDRPQVDERLCQLRDLVLICLT
jgi:hypothetical protein